MADSSLGELYGPAGEAQGSVQGWAQLAGAAPAPWYWWQSKVDGTRICAQVSPGPGWERASTAYAGPGCAPKPRVFVVPVR